MLTTPTSPPRLVSSTQVTAPSSLAPIREAAAAYTAEDDVDQPEKDHDVFICHASDDQSDVVRPLASLLVNLGVDVWYSEFALRIGDSLRRRIDAGLARSRFGVVVLSPAFFAKSWPQYELDGLVTREVSGGRQIILPIWHNIDQSALLRHSPSLADKLARTTANTTLDAIAREIADVVGV